MTLLRLILVATVLRGQSKVIRGVNLGRPYNRAMQDSFTSGCKDAHSRVNGDGVITWLRPVGEARVNAF